ncbi:MAG TPA: hypothetical protein PL193_07775 [Xanthobacteraceae bacterium]|nr:hypothetical protein [Xanthobacteraceae bacterium]
MASEQTPMSLSGALGWLVAIAGRAFEKRPFLHSEREADTFYRAHVRLVEEAAQPVPAVRLFFALTLTAAVAECNLVTPGTRNAQDAQILIGVLLPMVRADLAAVLEYERKMRS